MPARDEQPAILFTAFEPSGDDLAANVIRALRRRAPEAPIRAWGGPRMRDAGADVIEQTGADAVVGMPGPAKIMEHVRLNKRIAAWMDQNSVALHVPVDSPAANFPICKIAKQRGVKVAHLAAPQTWAWASWRVRKLRRLTDHVLCLLPFEEPWFRSRGVPATFVGHPIFDEPLDRDRMSARAESFPQGSPRLAIMPGSRPKELERIVPLLLEVYRRLARTRPQQVGVVAVQDEPAERRVREIAARRGGLPDSIAFTHQGVDAAAAWADLALTKSGTVTLHIARQRAPMVVVYRTPALPYLLVGRWLISTPDRAMPNLIAGERIVPEFIPHVGGPAPITRAAEALLQDDAARTRQREALDDVAHKFEGRPAADVAAEMLAKLAGLKPAPA